MTVKLGKFPQSPKSLNFFLKKNKLAFLEVILVLLSFYTNECVLSLPYECFKVYRVTRAGSKCTVYPLHRKSISHHSTYTSVVSLSICKPSIPEQVYLFAFNHAYIM